MIFIKVDLWIILSSKWYRAEENFVCFSNIFHSTCRAITHCRCSISSLIKHLNCLLRKKCRFGVKLSDLKPKRMLLLRIRITESKGNIEKNEESESANRFPGKVANSVQIQQVWNARLTGHMAKTERTVGWNDGKYYKLLS